jgi:pyruvate/2-oxoglutarate dehydrogenase complex dihydrolipoamide acyltransferase (E2) component
MMRDGMSAVDSDLQWQDAYLNRVAEHETVAGELSLVDGFILAYPLYTDSMPGIVVQFLDVCRRRRAEVFDAAPADAAPADAAPADAAPAQAAPAQAAPAEAAPAAPAESGAGATGDASDESSDEKRGPRIRAAFLVHSGFPEGVHTAHLEEVHRRICDVLELEYAGTIRKPGSEGVRMMPPFLLRGTKTVLEDAGAALARGKDVTAADVGRLVRVERLGPLRRLMLRISARTGTINFYWKGMLRKHGAWDKRYDSPYGAPYAG